MIYRHVYLAFVVALVLALAAVGCGSSSESSNSSPSTTESPSRTNLITPAKAKFIREADVICATMDKEQTAAVKAFLETHPEEKMSKSVEDAFTRTVGLRPVLAEAEELAALTPPSGDEDEVSAIIEGIKNAVAEAEKDPSSISKKAYGPFAAVDKMSRDYGFKVCSTAL